jgi:hypothetical protein
LTAALCREDNLRVSDAAEMSPAEVDGWRWGGISRTAGYVAGFGLFVGTLLFLLDATHVLGADPSFHKTAARPLQDEANFWVAFFAHKHHILWDIIARDTLLLLRS